MKQNGYTLFELIVSVAMLCALALVGWLIYAVIHFIIKFW